MRRIIAFHPVSADRYFATEDGKLDWMISVAARHLRIVLAQRDEGSSRTGRFTREGAALGRDSKTGEWINQATKIVFSRTRDSVNWHGSRLVREFVPADVEEMKRTSGKNILVLGSGDITRLLERHALIDDYKFGVVAVILGTGGFPTGAFLLPYAV